MSLARTTIGISRAFEGMVAGRPGRRGVVGGLISLSGLLVIALGMFLLLHEAPRQPVLAISALLVTIVVFSIMLIRHEWLLIIGILAGHTIFYGRFPHSLGMRIRDTVGPSDLLFLLAFIAALIYWASQRDKPIIPKSLIVPPALLFAYTAIYVMIAFFFWGRQDNALFQVMGWFYFTVAVPTYLCLTSGKVWKLFFGVIFVGLMAGAVLAFFVEAGIFHSVVQRAGYGGLGPRSFGDMTVRTNQLGMAVMGTLLAIVVAAYARNALWKYFSVLAGLSGALIMFFDRGRATYAGMAVAVVLVLLLLPNAARIRFALRGATAIIAGVLILFAIGGEVERKFTAAWEKATVAVQLTSRQAIQADPGIPFRMRRLRQAEAIFMANPMFGGGPGVHFGQDIDYRTYETRFITFIDNSWTYPLAVGGIIGMSLILLCYVTFVGGCIWAYRRLRHPFHKALALVPIGQMAWLLVCSTVNWWMVDRFHVAAFSFAVGMVFALVYHEKVQGSEKPVIDVGD